MTTTDHSPFPAGFVFNPSGFRAAVLATMRPAPEDHPDLGGDGPVLKRAAYQKILTCANGVDRWFRYTQPGVKIKGRDGKGVELHISEGIKRSCDALGTFWVLDIIQSAIPYLPTLDDDHMAVIKVARLVPAFEEKAPMARLLVDDGGAYGHVWYTQWIEYTDLPIHEIKWYFLPGHDGVVRVVLPPER